MAAPTVPQAHETPCNRAGVGPITVRRIHRPRQRPRLSEGEGPIRTLDKPESIEALLARVARRDRDAFAELYDRTAPKLFALVLRICRDRGLAEDALQEVYVDVWRKAGKFRAERGSAAAWLAVVARNRAIDALRRSAKPGAPGTEDPESFIERLPDPARLSDTDAALLTLLECLARLEERTRDMILLAYYEGWTREELAERAGAPVNTVKTWLRRGLASLRDCIGG